MSPRRYGRSAQLDEAAKNWFADKQFEILPPVSLPANLPQDDRYNVVGRMEADFRVYRDDIEVPKSVIILNGSTQSRNRKMTNWLRFQGDMGFFAVDECGVIFYIKGCDQCGGAKEINIQGSVSPKVCIHSGGLLSPEPSPPPTLSGLSVMDRIYYVLEHGAEARSAFDFSRGRHLLEWTGDQATHYLFSAKHIARHLNVSARVVRSELLEAGAEFHSLRRFGKLQRLWRLHIRASRELSPLGKTYEEPESIYPYGLLDPEGEDQAADELADFWEESIDLTETKDEL